MIVIPLMPILAVCFSVLGAFVATWAWLHSTYRKSTALYEHELEQELRLWSGEQGPELAYMSPSMAMQEINQALTLMACAVYHQPIEPYIPPPPDATPIIRIGASSEPIAWIDKAGEMYYPPEPEPRYELVMHDEGIVSDMDEVDHGKVGVS